MLDELVVAVAPFVDERLVDQPVADGEVPAALGIESARIPALNCGGDKEERA